MPSGIHERNLFQTSAPSTFSAIPSPRCFPQTQQVPKNELHGRLRCGKQVGLEDAAVDPQGELKPNHCANRIFACVRKIKKDLRFFFTASACLLLRSHFIWSLQRAGASCPASRKTWLRERRSCMPRSPTSSRAATPPRSWIPSWPWASPHIPREYLQLPRPDSLASLPGVDLSVPPAVPLDKQVLLTSCGHLIV